MVGLRIAKVILNAAFSIKENLGGIREKLWRSYGEIY